MKRKPKMWLIEVFNHRLKNYVPINDAFHYKKDAASVIPGYQKENPRAKYRVQAYVRRLP